MFISKPRWLFVVVGLFSIVIALPVFAEPLTQSTTNNNEMLSISFFHNGENLIVTDLLGTPVGAGVHTGEVRCKNGNCHKKTQLELSISNPAPGFATVEYKFDALLALDRDLRRAVVSGTGTISRDGQKARFEFTVTFLENGDGTLSARYDASMPEASFVIPNSPGTFEISSAS